MKSVHTFTCHIWIAGDYNDACRAVRKFCEEGACFAVSPVNYVYTGGSEQGVCVTRINYPRFPAEPDAILEQTQRLAEHLRCALFQDSYSIETPTETIWSTRSPSFIAGPA